MEVIVKNIDELTFDEIKKTKDSEECLGQGLCSEALVLLFLFVFFVFLEFFWFLAPEAFIGY